MFGWTIGNDVSERTWQRKTDRTELARQELRHVQAGWARGSSLALITVKMTTVIRLNGEEVERVFRDG